MNLKKLLPVAIATAVMAAALFVYTGSSANNNAPASSDASSGAAASSTVEDTSDAVYTLKNATGMKVTELYIYNAESQDKGTNHAGEGLDADASVVVTTAYSAEAKAATYVLEFVTEDGAVQKFETLYYEVASIDLLSVDVAAGATPIVFGW